VTTALSRSGPAGNRPGQRDNLLDLPTFAAAAGLHPEFVVRLVNLGLIEASPGAAHGPVQGATDELWFSPTQLAVAARIQRLRSGLALNYAALGLVIDLLDRVTELETTVRKLQRGGRTWTRTV
jgi:hypothetical protein